MDSLEGEPQVILLTGDPGSGKTFFLRQLERKLWEKYNGPNDPIPIFVSLSDVDDVTLDFLGKALRSRLFDDNDYIRHLKLSNRQMFLICDGYDEIQVQRNIYNSNKFNTPGHGRVKLVITCRSCKIGRDSDGQFRPEPTNRYDLTDLNLFRKVAMAPFTYHMVVEYVEKYAARHLRPVVPQSSGNLQNATQSPQPETPPSSSLESSRVWSAQQYMETLSDVPNLMELVKNPCILSFILERLPEIAGSPHGVFRSGVSFDKLYKHIFDRWIEVAKRRLRARVKTCDEVIEFEALLHFGFAEICMAYVKSLVVETFGNQTKTTPVRFTVEDGAVWRVRRLETDTRTRLLQESIPLSRSGTSYRFIYPSLLEYGFALLIFDPKHCGMDMDDTETEGS
ncbi:hypothetical protein BGZ91_008971, partial [Linnemannia elongata]